MAEHLHEPSDRPGRAGALDKGGRQLAATVLAAAGRGDHATIDELTAPLDVDQLRTLVATLANQVDQVMADQPATGPAAVCALAINAAAPLFGVTPEDIRSPQRSRPVSDARAVAMTAARETGLSLPSIAAEFGKDHASVIHAVRRTEQRPRLADAAARVTQHVQGRYTQRLPRRDLARNDVEPPSVGTPRTAAASAFDPHDLVDHAVVAAAQAFATTPESLIGTDRTRVVADARGVAMTAAWMRGQSLPQIARLFDRNHTTVLQATRRIQQTPPLRDLAVKIAGGLPEHPASDPTSDPTSDSAVRRPGVAGGPDARLREPTGGPDPDQPNGPHSPGAARERRQAPAGSSERHLRVAR